MLRKEMRNTNISLVKRQKSYKTKSGNLQKTIIEDILCIIRKKKTTKLKLTSETREPSKEKPLKHSF